MFRKHFRQEKLFCGQNKNRIYLLGSDYCCICCSTYNWIFSAPEIRKYQPVQDGLEFEVLCTQILTAKGYENVELTPTTGDYGVDIFAEKDGVRWAFQCKYYTNPVGVRAVQEIYSGRDFYHCMVGVVMTNSRFTKNAVTLANELNILLWDGNMLDKLLL